MRLHEPYPMFTAGNIQWQIDKDPSHLATKGEVLDHMQHCYEVAAGRTKVVGMFGWEEESHEEIDGVVRIRCRSSTGETCVIEADRLIRAPGFAIEPNAPLQLSSTRVHSVSPDHCDMGDPEIAASDAPVWVVGSGKTGMDTAHALVTAYPCREVNLIAGSGVVSTNRDEVFPKGFRRWWAGRPGGSLFRAVARRFDGTNETEVREWYHDSAGISVVPKPRTFLFSLISESENRTISEGLHHVLVDHLDDVVDRDEGTKLILRSGETMAVEPGSWFVNCTGYLLQGDQRHEPAASPSGKVVSINMRAHTLWWTSLSAYFLTHLMFNDKLADAPLYELDTIALRNKKPDAVAAAVLTMMMHNMSIVADLLPPKVMTQSNIAQDRTHPWPRRMASTLGFLATHRRDRKHWRSALDTFRERHGIAGGVRAES